MKHVCISLCSVLLLLSPMITLAADASKMTFTICSEKENYPPFGLGAEPTYPEHNPGILVEIISAAATQADLDPKHVRLPWKRCLKLLELNQVDGTFASIYLKEREVLGRYPLKPKDINLISAPDPNRRLVRVTYSLFKNKNSPFDWDGDNFSNLNHSIGAPLGYVVVKKLKEDHGIKADTVRTPAKGFRLVSKGLLDAYIIESNIGRSLIADLNLADSLVEIKVPFAQYDLHLMISHGFYNKNQNVAEKLWDEIGKYREEHMPRLLDHYRNLP